MDAHHCDQCGTPLTVGDWPYCPHGRFTPAHLAVIDDSCNMLIENMATTPLHFTSKSEWRRKMKELGLVNNVRHVGTPGEGSDKSPYTSRWT